ncbi:AraC family transcriptional regulator [Paenibacillus nasutitermitis]|uniref:HTH araC/xylS-type domain-containing protein n=1 Tax=Paenibacillus nasutitermitis TaxID=1652958 RepID=A0A916ZCJ8_9BACL|nr:AraC family transcriptional regulator [Paenibacillus nasutitermitis]GGD88224.1 hypothetical protein GCM10010911_53430 [Paenibacillus nasutitermitis]
MSVFPEYQDVSHRYERGDIPFYLSVHSISTLHLLHHHDFAELALVVEGHGSEVLNGVSHELKPGTVSFLLPHHLHELRNLPGGQMKIYCCMFDMNMLYDSEIDSELVRLLLGSGESYSSFSDLTEDQTLKLRGIFDDIIAENHTRLPGRSSFVRAKLIEALLLYVRSLRLAAPGHLAATSLHVRKILQYIHSNYAERISLEDISIHLVLSVPYICRLFKEHLGQSFLDYLHKLRVQSACHLLASSRMPITDVVANVGFESYRSFSRVFKQLKGVTPKQFRSSNRLGQ